MIISLSLLSDTNDVSPLDRDAASLLVGAGPDRRRVSDRAAEQQGALRQVVAHRIGIDTWEKEGTASVASDDQKLTHRQAPERTRSRTGWIVAEDESC